MANCIICDSNQSTEGFYPKLAFNNKIFEYRKCRNCKGVYLVPSLTDEDTKKIYRTEYHDEFYFKSGSGKNKKHQAELLSRYKSGGRFLDYGCGDASFLYSLQNEGFELNGAEYDIQLVNKLSRSYPHIKFYSTASLQEASNGGFDIVHACDVLGQVADPKQVLSTLRSYLAPGGILFIESPVEHNFHLLYLLRAGYFRFRKWLNPGRIVNGTPFRVMFTNRKNQELFFNINGFRTLHYELFEWAWPFPDKWRDAKSTKQKTEFLVGALSKFVSKRIRGWGNRFIYIGTPDES